MKSESFLKTAGRRPLFFLFVLLFPCDQNAREGEGKNTEHTAHDGKRPEELGGDSGIDQIEIDQHQCQREADGGQDDGYDVKRDFDFFHVGEFLPGRTKRLNCCSFFVITIPCILYDVKSAREIKWK